MAEPVHSEYVHGVGASAAKHDHFCMQCQRFSAVADSSAAALEIDGYLVEFPNYILLNHGAGGGAAIYLPQKII